MNNNITNDSRKVNNEQVHLPQPAQFVVCSNWGRFLAFIHLFDGISLLMIDVATELSISKNPAGVSLAFLFIVCSILCFISTRRLDRFALKLLVVIALASLVSSSYLFGVNGLFLNKECMNAKNCSEVQQMTHSQLTLLGLIEVFTSLGTIVFCYRALRSNLSSVHGYTYNNLIVDDESSMFTSQKSQENNHEEKIDELKNEEEENNNNAGKSEDK